MEQIYFGERIAALRKSHGLTQEALAQKLGITNQAVSKWESDQCCPDIMQLPALADIFEISLDALFGRDKPETPPQEPEVIKLDSLPWEDNNDLHAVCYVGHRLVRYQDLHYFGKRERFPFSFTCMGFEVSGGKTESPVQLSFTGTVGNIYSDFDVICTNSQIQGSIQAGDSITCGSIGGSANAGDSISCSGNIGTNAQAGDDIQCTGFIGGSATAGSDLKCGGDIYGRVQCDSNVQCHGSIKGDVRADGSVRCSGSITGNVTAEGSITCGDIHGSVSAEGEIHCNGIGSSAT